ncbi:organic hydroperoxide reductase OsmC/OhrA [Friedmanniella endophytica]|uniref:Organic hydroperoxide reductase OsmC/OhrA n=1 Tax=Microlunatus kandeliicorticis TaxID=1759536 RepID=A0A7W3P6Q6_9ACTN|nr:OsmC family protein [Microlunatus kandeliicorticis]MBA8795180.1 organic hydroperoxide reductase OsmC/OhrA [Microlunatus kandeliicorticis]
MTGRTHHYRVEVVWTGDRGEGTRSYRSYARDHEVRIGGKVATAAGVLAGSSDRTFHGDATRWNPEELLTAALSQCHLLSYLHVCAVSGVVVTGYTDEAVGTMVTDADGGGHFTEVVLRPRVTLSPGSDRELALALHDRAHRLCFIASSVAFPVRHEPTVAD